MGRAKRKPLRKRKPLEAMLFQLFDTIFMKEDVETLLQIIAKEAANFVGSDAAAVFLPEEGSRILRIVASYNLDSNYVKKVRAKMGDGVPGRVIAEKKPKIIPDASKFFEEKGDREALELIKSAGICSAASVPILLGEEGVGTLNIHYFRKHHFSLSEIESLSIFAKFSAIAIQNARRLREREERAEKLAELSDVNQRLLSANSSEEIYEICVESAFRLLPCDKSAFLLVNEESQIFEMKYGRIDYGEKRAEPYIFRLSDAPKEIIEKEQFKKGLLYIRNLEDYSETLSLAPFKDAISFVSVPIWVGDKFLGILVVSHKEPFHFKDYELTPFEVLGKQMSLALEKLHFLDEINIRNKEIESALQYQLQLNTELYTLQSLSTALVSSLNIDEILKIVVEGVKNSLGFGKVLISLIDKSGKFLERKAWAGIPASEIDRLQQYEPPLDYILGLFQDRFRISRSYFISHMESYITDEKYVYTDYSKSTKEILEDDWHPHDMLLSPFYSREGELLGIMSVDEPQDGKIPSRRKILSIEMFANAASSAIENSKLYEKERNMVKQLSAIADVGTTVTSVLNLAKLLDEVVNTISNTFGYYRIAILIVEGNELVYKSGAGYPPSALDGLRLKIGTEGVTGLVAMTGEPKLISDVSLEPLYIAMDPNVKCELAVPLNIKNKTIGVLNVEDIEIGKLDNVDLKLLSTLATQIAIAIENARLYEEAQRRIDELSVLHGVGRSVSSVLKLNELLNEILKILDETFHYTRASISLIENKSEIVVKATRGYERDIVGFREKIGEEKGIIAYVAETGKSLIIPDVTKEPKYIPFESVEGSEICVPLIFKGEVTGVLDVEDERIGIFGDSDAQLLSTLGAHISVAIENARLYEEKEKEAITDEMTGLFNFRHFQKTLSDEIRRAKRYTHPVSVIMLDVDDFKLYNDHFGHPAGDELLRLLAKILKDSVRDTDSAYRYGGEEFVVVLPETKKEEALIFAERIMKKVRDEKFPFGESQPLGKVTISLGIASYPEDATGEEEIIDKADKALYKAKKKGKNRIGL